MAKDHFKRFLPFTAPQQEVTFNPILMEAFDGKNPRMNERQWHEFTKVVSRSGDDAYADLQVKALHEKFGFRESPPTPEDGKRWLDFDTKGKGFKLDFQIDKLLYNHKTDLKKEPHSVTLPVSSDIIARTQGWLQRDGHLQTDVLQQAEVGTDYYLKVTSTPSREIQQVYPRKATHTSKTSWLELGKVGSDTDRKILQISYDDTTGHRIMTQTEDQLKERPATWEDMVVFDAILNQARFSHKDQKKQS